MHMRKQNQKHKNNAQQNNRNKKAGGFEISFNFGDETPKDKGKGKNNNKGQAGKKNNPASKPQPSKAENGVGAVKIPPKTKNEKATSPRQTDWRDDGVYSPKATPIIKEKETKDVVPGTAKDKDDLNLEFDDLFVADEGGPNEKETEKPKKVKKGVEDDGPLALDNIALESKAKEAELHRMGKTGDLNGHHDEKEEGGEEDEENDEAAKAELGVGPGEVLNPARSKVGRDDFKLLKLIGQGGYGKVYQVADKATGQIYAMKVLRKTHLIDTNAVEGTITERDVLRTVRHPFIVSLHYAFQTEGKLYLVMDYMNGGQLFFHLRNEAMFSEDLVRFYAAEIVLALEHLHSLGIIHRDLKPENILLNSDGHLALADFGLAKEIQEGERTRTFCGTLEYMAPEMIKGNGYDKSADWWSVGVLIYDMLTGTPPFMAKHPGELEKKILAGKIRLPPYISKEANSLIRGLMNKDVKQRLTLRQIKSHPFFKGISFKKLLARELDPPFRPNVAKGMLDTSNFEDRFTNVAPIDSPVNSLDKISESQANIFAGFSYVRSVSPSSPQTDEVSSPLELADKNLSSSDTEGESGDSSVLASTISSSPLVNGTASYHRNRNKDKDNKNSDNNNNNGPSIDKSDGLTNANEKEKSKEISEKNTGGGSISGDGAVELL